MKKIILCLLLIVFGLTITNDTMAHPGNTASDGCHYCRTNCDYWGVPWNQRHCHGGGSAPAPVQRVNSAPEPSYQEARTTNYNSGSERNNEPDNTAFWGWLFFGGIVVMVATAIGYVASKDNE